MSKIPLTPLAAFEAALLTWAAELARPAHLSQLPDRTTAEAWLEENDEAALRAALPTILDGPQCVCLLANLAFLIGRLSHYHGTKSADTPMKFRVTGMMLTFAAIAGGAVTILVLGAQ